MRKLLVPLLAALVSIAGLVAAPPPASAATAQWRSFWVDTWNPGIFDASQVRQVVADAKAANANVLLVQVVRRFECYCNKSDYPRTTVSGMSPDFDPLAEIIRQGHAAGLEVHAWVNVNTFWSSSTPPRDPAHPFNTFGPTATGANRWLNKRSDGVEQVGSSSYLDLANPAARADVARRVASIVENYAVDGINLDYIRYPDHNTGGAGNQWGYSETSLQRFRTETGRTDRPTGSDWQFSDFRRAQVTATVSGIRDAINRVAPSVELSVNGISYGYGPSTNKSWESTDPYAAVLQDWAGWARRGLVDAVVLMNYKSEASSTQAAMFASWNKFLASLQQETGRVMVSGQGLYMNSIENSLKQARDVTSLGLGWSGYSYANASAVAVDTTSQSTKTAERQALIRGLAAGPFKEWAAPPLMSWKPTASRDLYVIPGYHEINGRQWRTDCEAYSQTRRCRTDILATQVTWNGSRYVTETDWVFNNLTYLPLMTRAQWAGNPLGFSGEFVSDGRPWRTECDTPATGRGGCRSSVMVYGIVQATRHANGTYSYERVDKWVFNNMVRFLER
ncbi:family 10 glycosylhydrolase [Tessaracoccus sp. OS52]|uniref:glycoside hydrolase family 10 protein n=1 Tax=Tessaracoccus sp. OS52 TaxID=2886691 RepID=UPI001D1232C5|nr:family 10 glycosylhydrolase [Tessaracoccus sp. OS52]MCC2591901.1 family 10 glycosylhydrolase [Tessaracoccus sp. OS52]